MSLTIKLAGLPPAAVFPAPNQPPSSLSALLRRSKIRFRSSLSHRPISLSRSRRRAFARRCRHARFLHVPPRPVFDTDAAAAVWFEISPHEGALVRELVESPPPPILPM